MNSRTKLIMVTGFPASGKTFTSRLMSRCLGIDCFAAGDIRNDLTTAPEDGRNDKQIRLKILHFVILKRLQNGLSTIVDTTFNQRAERFPVYEMLNIKDVQLELLVVRTECSENSTSERIGARQMHGAGFPLHVRNPAIWSKYRDTYESIEEDLPIKSDLVPLITYHTDSQRVIAKNIPKDGLNCEVYNLLKAFTDCWKSTSTDS